MPGAEDRARSENAEVSKCQRLEMTECDFRNDVTDGEEDGDDDQREMNLQLTTRGSILGRAAGQSFSFQTSWKRIGGGTRKVRMPCVSGLWATKNRSWKR